ncbi:uncharacterized protein LOC124807837 isoform X2 [Hydra vulgaris]|uniref:uncharacterized protein LOC124807837 isoform X2 n=1 Tax=Hydra vulgaris TaxID=6087 RepID=UPI0032EA8E9C
MDKLKKLEDSVENLKKVEHSMEKLENSIASISSAVPSAIETVLTAVPPATISAGPSAMHQDFLRCRFQHPGPISQRAFYRWCQYGGDDPSFRWRRQAPYDTIGRRRGAGKQFNSFNFYQ